MSRELLQCLAPAELRCQVFHPQVFHKLKGELTGSLACSAGYDLRLIFEFVPHEGAEAILLQNIGTHEEVY